MQLQVKIEDAEHFLFRCPKYANEITILFRDTHNYHPLKLNMILFGDTNATPESNTTIFKAVQNYIKNTKRFSDSYTFYHLTLAGICCSFSHDLLGRTHIILYLFIYLSAVHCSIVCFSLK